MSCSSQQILQRESLNVVSPEAIDLPGRGDESLQFSAGLATSIKAFESDFDNRASGEMFLVFSFRSLNPLSDAHWTLEWTASAGVFRMASVRDRQLLR